MRLIRIATHNGSFHADDVFGVAVLMLLHPGAELVRTRDEQVVAAADFAVDVGGEWDPARGRFDHHQRDALRRGKRLEGSLIDTDPSQTTNPPF